MDKKPFRAAVIGCGRISVMHMQSIAALEGVTLCAVCDIKEQRAREAGEKYNVPYYTDYVKMLDEVKPDAVHICLPHYLHSEAACRAFERGIAALSEKPMDINLERAEAAVEYSEKKGVLYGIISQCRYNNSAALVKRAATEGKLGKIYSARSVLTWSRSDEYYSESDWKGTWDKEGGGVIIDQAIHSIDLVNWIVDSDPVKISVSMANRGHKLVDVEDSAEGLIEYANGTKYGFYCMNNYAIDEPIEIRLCCERANVVFGYDDAYIYYKDGRIEEAHQGDVMNYEGGKDYWGFQHIRQISQFYRALRGEEPLEISGREALKTHRLIMELYRLGGMKK